MGSKKHTAESETLGLGGAVAVLVPGGLLALLSTTVVGVTVPDIVSDLGSNLASVQWVSTAYMLAAGIAIPVGGWASVRFGMRSTWLVAIVLFALGAIAGALAPNLVSLIAARTVQGAGGGALEPLMLTALARAAGPRRMGRVMGSVSVVMSMGPLAGPALGGFIVDELGWRWIYVFTAALGMIVAAGSFVALKQDRLQASRFDVPGFVLVSVATVLGLFGLSRAAGPQGFDVIAIASVAASAVATVLFVPWARRLGERAIVDLTTFRFAGFGAAIVIMMMMGGAIYPLFFGMPQFYQSVVGLDASTAGLLMIPYGVGNLVIMPIAGWLSDRMDGRWIVLSGASATLAAFVMLLATGPATPVAAFGAIALVIGLGLGSISSPTVSAMYRVLPPALVPAASTIFFVVIQFGGALGVAISVLLIGTTWTPAVGSDPFWIPVVAVVGIAAAAVRLAGSAPSEARDAVNPSAQLG